MSAIGEDPEILPISVADAGEVLTVQRAAFVGEALVYDDPDMPALTETEDEIVASLPGDIGCVLRVGGRLVGVVRARIEQEVLKIGPLAIAPDAQGSGFGGLLMDAAERRGRDAGAEVVELFTGSESTANLRFYTSLGYREHARVPTEDGVEEVYLRKSLA